MHLKYSLFTLLVLSITASSAGYLWCERTQHCERSWELADAAGIPHTEAEVKAYCNIIGL
ncbi:hypothetical protein ACPSKX_22135 [Moritella viscosa]